MAHILVVEDESHIRTLIKQILRKRGHEVIEAANGIEALALFKAGQFDLILADFNMPQMNGLELIKELCKDAAHPPIIIVTAFAQHIPEAFENGAAYSLHKPFAQRQLVEVVSNAIAPLSVNH